MNTQSAAAFLEDRPTLWPNRVAEKVLPAEVDQCLFSAHQCTFSAREQAVQQADQAVTLARSFPEPSVLARTLYQAATIMRRARRPDRAFVLCLEAQPLLERLDERWRASCVVLLRGECYLDVGEHERALELINEAAERFVNLDDRAQLGRCYTAMAKAYMFGGDLRKAVDHAVKSLALLDASSGSVPLRHQLKNNEAHLRLMLGEQLAEQGHSVLAQDEYARAVQALPDLDEIDVTRWDTNGAAVLDTSIAVHIAAGDLARARDAMKKLAGWARRWNSPVEKGQAWLRLADFRVMQGARHQAIACARRAARHLDTLPLEAERVAAQLLLARLLEETGDLKGAYEAHCEAGEVEARQQKESIAMRAELLTLDLEAEQELRKTAQTLAYAQRLSNVGHMVASINHELNQPMSSIKMLAETTIELLNMGDRQEALANIEVMHRLSSRLVDLTSKLAAFPAQSVGEQQPRVGVKHAVGEALAILRSRLAQTPCEIVQELAEVDVQATEGQLVRVLANLLNNALDAMEGCAKRQIVIASSVEAQQVVLRLSDSGPGIPDSVRERLFQPFFSTKAAGQGLGLGLALSRDVVREMNGDLTAGNDPRGGAVFCVTLPLATDQAC
jgi:signal transduction histidine kinase